MNLTLVSSDFLHAVSQLISADKEKVKRSWRVFDFVFVFITFLFR